MNKNINCLRDFFSSDKLSKNVRDIKFRKYDSLFRFDNFIVKYVSFDPSMNVLYLFLFCYIFNLYEWFP